nr:cytochrome c family protein [Rugamonas apoptosis]
MPRWLALLALAGAVSGPVHAAGDVAAGKTAFRKCASCHQVGPSARGGFGPQLNGIVGRPAAATSDYKYSDAMRQSRIVWNAQALSAFLRAPGDVVPGTRMRFWGISDAQQIADLLAYLRTLR